MHRPAGLGLAALVLTGCGGSDTPPAGRYVQVIWKTETPVRQRTDDLRACALQAIGLTASATQDEIDAAAMATPAPEHDRLLRECLAARGYQMVEFPACTEGEVALRRILATETLPPVDQVRCVTPDKGGFVAL